MAMHRDQHKVVDCSVLERAAADNLATIVNGDSEHGIQVPVGVRGKNVVRSIPWLVALGQRKGRSLEKSSLNPLPTIWPLSLMPVAAALVNSPTALRITAGLELLAQNTARSAEKSALRANPTMFPAPLMA